MILASNATPHGDALNHKQGVRYAPEPFNSLIDRVCARDAAWFAAHPDETHFVRPYVPGEVWPQLIELSDSDAMLVTQICPGVRFRQGIQVRFKQPIPDRIPVMVGSTVVFACVAAELRRAVGR